MTCTVPTFVSVLPPSRLDSRGQCLSLQTTKRLSGRSVVAQSFHSSRILCSAAPNPSTSPTVQPVPKVEPSTPTPTAGGFTDPSFIEAVSGEWFGYQVTFSGKTGAPQEIDVRQLCYFLPALLFHVLNNIYKSKAMLVITHALSCNVFPYG